MSNTEQQIEILPAPMGLSEYRCSDGKTYYSKDSADAHQKALNEAKNYLLEALE